MNECESKNIESDHISACDRKPPYSNWFYVGLVYVTEKGNEVETARLASTISSPERRKQAGERKIGQPVGFGLFENEIVKDYRVVLPEFKQHPEGLKIRIKDDAATLLTRHLSNSRSSQCEFMREERRSISFLRENAGRVFEVMHDESVPQMSPTQFFNTMPTPDAPAGFFLPRGLCELQNPN